MRILHVLDHSIPSHSGYSFRTLSILREQRRLGWDTFHLTSPKQPEAKTAEQDVEGWHFFRTLPLPGWLDAMPVLREVKLMRELASRLDEVARQVRPDVIHAHSPVLNAIPALRVGRRLGIPVVYEIRAFWEDAAVDHGTAREGDLRYRLTRALETRALGRADAVTTICEGLRADIVARGIPESKVTVIPNAVDIEKFQVDRKPDEGLRAELGLTGRTVLGFLGSFYAYEGLPLLLEALPILQQTLPDVRVLLVGGGPQEALLKEMARRLGVEGSVVFRGRVPHGEIGRYYDLVDVLTYPRLPMRLTELVTPLKPLEAMAQGRLLVASDVGGHRELIRDGQTGLLFRAGDARDLARAVTTLLQAPENWAALRARGREFVERERTWTNSVARYREVYGRVVRGPSP